MRKVREILRMRWGLQVSVRETARSVGVAYSTARDLLRRAEQAGLSWPLPEDMDDEALRRLLYRRKDQGQGKPLPNWQWTRRELQSKIVTLQQLWFEYIEDHPDGYAYSQFCNLYRDWRKKLDLVMRQTHRAGEKAFVDYAGSTVPVVDPGTGQIRQAQIFVCVLGASNYTYAEATWGQDLFSWLSSHCRAFEFFGGVTEILVPDNLKSGISRTCRYEPDENPAYRDLASHYGTAVIPARPVKPKDKAKVEAGVQLVQRWILAVLRHRTFFSLHELNEAIWELLKRLNERPFKKMEGSRKSAFETIDKPALKPLPPERYQFAQWYRVRVSQDYHVRVEDNHYSVPYQLVKEEVEARVTDGVVEILFRGRRVSSHRRLTGKGEVATDPRHQPASHRRHAEWTPSRLVAWSESVGPNTREMVDMLMKSRPHPEQGFRSCMGLVNLGKKYPPERLEAACGRALALKIISYKSVRSMLQSGLDKVSLDEDRWEVVVQHENVRGPEYYAPSREENCDDEPTYPGSAARDAAAGNG